MMFGCGGNGFGVNASARNHSFAKPDLIGDQKTSWPIRASECCQRGLCGGALKPLWLADSAGAPRSSEASVFQVRWKF